MNDARQRTTEIIAREMIRPALRAVIGFGFVIGAFCVPLAASAAIETDPQALFAKMTEAYADGAKANWSFESQRYYESVVFATGRSYSLFRKDDPNYRQVARLAVDVAKGLHYDPLGNEDASAWYVREAANWCRTNDLSRAADANVILARIEESEQSEQDAARVADADATANVVAFHGDSSARVQQVIVDFRAANFAHDEHYKALALTRAANPLFPLIRVPTTPQQALFSYAQDTLDNAQADPTLRAAAKAIIDRRNATPALQEIGSVTAPPHALHLSITAPADEYFGPRNMSVLGLRNEMVRLKKYLDAGYGARETVAGTNLTAAFIQLQHTYPRDFEIPRLIAQAVPILDRIPAPQSSDDSRTLRRLLLWNYPDTKQARDMLSTGRGPDAGGDDAPAQSGPHAAPNADDDSPQSNIPRAKPDIAQHAIMDAMRAKTE